MTPIDPAVFKLLTQAAAPLLQNVPQKYLARVGLAKIPAAGAFPVVPVAIAAVATAALAYPPTRKKILDKASSAYCQIKKLSQKPPGNDEATSSPEVSEVSPHAA